MKAALSGGTGFTGAHVLDEDTRREFEKQPAVA